jgi:hypothetical protein
MNGLRPFKSRFLAVDPNLFQEARRELAGALDSAFISGLLGYLGSPPTTRSIRFANDGGTHPLTVRGLRAHYTTTTNPAGSSWRVPQTPS